VSRVPGKAAPRITTVIKSTLVNTPAARSQLGVNGGAVETGCEAPGTAVIYLLRKELSQRLPAPGPLPGGPAGQLETPV
jgi:hypothetical protein